MKLDAWFHRNAPVPVRKAGPVDEPRDHGKWTTGGGSGASPEEPDTRHDAAKAMVFGSKEAADAPENTPIPDETGEEKPHKIPKKNTPVEERDLLGIDSNAKTVKGGKKQVATGIMYLAPSTESGVMNTCAFASKKCAAECLKSSGRMVMNAPARLWKTQALKDNPKAFIDRLDEEVSKLERTTGPDSRSKYKGFMPAVRLNGTSDLPWQNVKGSDGKNLMEKHPNVQFYDYTKNPNQALAHDEGRLPPNYHLTFSRSEENDPESPDYDQKKGNYLDVLKRGKTNVAVPFDVPTDKYGDKGHPLEKYPDKKKGEYVYPLPPTFHGYPVLNGDEDDLRFMDPKGGHVVGLRAKGEAKHEDKEGPIAGHFVIPTIGMSEGLSASLKKPPKPADFVEKAQDHAIIVRVSSQDPGLVAASHRWMPNECVHGEGA